MGQCQCLDIAAGASDFVTTEQSPPITSSDVHILVTPLNGVEVTLSGLSAYSPLSELEAAIAISIGVPCKHQRLVFGESEIPKANPGATLASLGIHDGAHLTVANVWPPLQLFAGSHFKEGDLYRLELTVTADLRDRAAAKVVVNATLDQDGLDIFEGMPMTCIEMDDFEGPLDFDQMASSFVIHAQKDVAHDAIDILGQAGSGAGDIQLCLRMPWRGFGDIWVTLAPASDAVMKLDARLTDIDREMHEAAIEQQEQLSVGKFGSDATKRLWALAKEQQSARSALEEALHGGRSSTEANMDASGLDSLGPLLAALGQMQAAVKEKS